MAPKSQFSVKAAILTSVIHFGLTYVFLILPGVAAFENATRIKAILNIVTWAWTPVARAMVDGEFGFTAVSWLAFGWSCIVGVTVGFLWAKLRSTNKSSGD